MDALDKDQLVTEIVVLGGRLDEGVQVELSNRIISLGQLEEGTSFIVEGEEGVFQIRGGVACALEFVLPIRRNPSTRYVCEDGGYGPDTGQPII